MTEIEVKYFLWHVNGVRLFCWVVIAMKIKTHENLTREYFITEKFSIYRISNNCECWSTWLAWYTVDQKFFAGKIFPQLNFMCFYFHRYDHPTNKPTPFIHCWRKYLTCLICHLRWLAKLFSQRKFPNFWEHHNLQYFMATQSIKHYNRFGTYLTVTIIGGY